MNITEQEYEALVQLLAYTKYAIDAEGRALKRAGQTDRRAVREAFYMWAVARRAVVKLGRSKAEKARQPR